MRRISIARRKARPVSCLVFPGRSSSRFLNGLSAACLSVMLLAPSVLHGSEENDLQNLRERIHDTRVEMETLAGKETGILSSIMKVDEELSLTNRLISGLESRRKQIEVDLEQLHIEKSAAEKELGRRRARLEMRLCSLYKFGGYHEFEVLFGSRSVSDLVSRFDRLVCIVSRDDQLYRAVAQESERLVRTREELARRGTEIRLIEEERSRERKGLIRRKQGRKDLLVSVQSEKRSYEKLVAELEEASRVLERIIAERSSHGEEDFSGPSLFDGGAGRLPWPVEGRIIRGFGSQRHPEFGTVLTNNGIDIDAAGGSEILAVAPGRVEYVSTLPGYGNCIIVRHGGGYYTLYAHASEILVTQGKAVGQGEALATVGSTGSVTGTSLHFEIRKGTKPLDPLQWLR